MWLRVFKAYLIAVSALLVLVVSASADDKSPPLPPELVKAIRHIEKGSAKKTLAMVKQHGKQLLGYAEGRAALIELMQNHLHQPTNKKYGAALHAMDLLAAHVSEHSQIREAFEELLLKPHNKSIVDTYIEVLKGLSNSRQAELENSRMAASILSPIYADNPEQTKVFLETISTEITAQLTADPSIENSKPISVLLPALKGALKKNESARKELLALTKKMTGKARTDSISALAPFIETDLEVRKFILSEFLAELTSKLKVSRIRDDAFAHLLKTSTIEVFDGLHAWWNSSPKTLNKVKISLRMSAAAKAVIKERIRIPEATKILIEVLETSKEIAPLAWGILSELAVHDSILRKQLITLLGSDSIAANEIKRFNVTMALASSSFDDDVADIMTNFIDTILNYGWSDKFSSMARLASSLEDVEMQIVSPMFVAAKNNVKVRQKLIDALSKKDLKTYHTVWLLDSLRGSAANAPELQDQLVGLLEHPDYSIRTSAAKLFKGFKTLHPKTKKAITSLLRSLHTSDHHEALDLLRAHQLRSTQNERGGAAFRADLPTPLNPVLGDEKLEMALLELLKQKTVEDRKYRLLALQILTDDPNTSTSTRKKLDKLFPKQLAAHAQSQALMVLDAPNCARPSFLRRIYRALSRR